MIVVVSAAAEADLEAIGDHIAEDNPARALSFVRELRDLCLGLAAIPRAFPLVPRYEHQGVRWRVYGNYLIFYRLEADTVTVLHILHGAVDFAPILFPS